ncbi:MAG: chemotaxis protein CheW [Blastocatellia bacterium]|nr:chemotaxis protein CheW [Blastocatellia bacterium]
MEDKALLSEYLSETEQLLDSLLSDLDSLGAQPGQEVYLINRIFRTVHSLKGLSGMMGLGEVKSLAHEFENLLDRVRLGHCLLDRKTTAALREAGAGLASLVGNAVRGSADPEDFDRLREVITTIAARAPASGENAEVELPGLSSRERALLTKYERRRIIENLAADRKLYAINVRFEAAALDAGYRALAAELNENGELIATLPGEATGPDRVAFKLIEASLLKASEIRRILKPFGGRVSQLNPPSRRKAESRSEDEMQLPPTAYRLLSASQTPPHEEKKSSAKSPSVFESLRPLSPSVRVELSQIDDLSGLAHELAIETQKLSSMADRFLDAAGLGARERFDLRLSGRKIKREFLELEERLVELRMVSLTQTFTRASRLAERLAGDLGKAVSVEIAGRETQLDKVIVDRISDPIYHVLRNAIDHGLESPAERRRAGKSARGRVKLEAGLEGARAIIAISDDGRGIDPLDVRRRAREIGALASDEELSQEETLRLIFRPGFSTAEQVSSVSGRGVGLDTVERAVHELGGEILVFSDEGKGTRFELVVPTTLVMISAFIVRVGEWRYAINVGQIVELLYVAPNDILGRDGKRSIRWRGYTIPLVELRYLLALGGARVLGRPGETEHAASIPPRARLREMASARQRVPVLITRAAGLHVAVAVERFDEQREIIVKSLGSLARKIKGVTGAVDLEGGDVAPVLDLSSLLILRSLRM